VLMMRRVISRMRRFSRSDTITALLQRAHRDQAGELAAVAQVEGAIEVTHRLTAA
jgi:hypothetical protein